MNDCILTFVGRTWYQDAAQKENNSMKVSVSTDNQNYTLVKEYKSNDNADMNQTFTHDLSEYVKGASTVYVRFDFLVFDSPHIMGLSSLSLVGNIAGSTGQEAGTTEPNGATGSTDTPATGIVFPAMALVGLGVSAAVVSFTRKHK